MIIAPLTLMQDRAGVTKNTFTQKFDQPLSRVHVSSITLLAAAAAAASLF
jgi:hypothetical protein